MRFFSVLAVSIILIAYSPLSSFAAGNFSPRASLIKEYQTWGHSREHAVELVEIARIFNCFDSDGLLVDYDGSKIVITQRDGSELTSAQQRMHRNEIEFLVPLLLNCTLENGQRQFRGAHGFGQRN